MTLVMRQPCVAFLLCLQGRDEITSGLLFNLVWKNNCYLLAVSFDFWEIHCIFVKK